jgi:Rad3-related DNA helicase
MGDFSYRVGQREAIDAIISAWDSGYKTVILDAPTGSGKTLIADTVGKIAWEKSGWSGYFTSPLVSLIQQVEADPLVGPGISTLTGRRNYLCDWVAHGPQRPRQYPISPPLMADEAPCVTGMKCPKCNGTGWEGDLKCKKKVDAKDILKICPALQEGRCEYYRRKAAAMAAPLAGLTLAYLLRAVRVDADEDATGFTARDYLFIDEAHNLESSGRQELSFGLSRKSLDTMRWGAFWENDIGFQIDQLEDMPNTEVIEILQKASECVEEAVNISAKEVEESDGDRKLYREFVRRSSLLTKLHTSLSMPSESWAFTLRIGKTRTEPYLEVSPVTSRAFLKLHMWPLAEHRVLSSGTFGDIKEYLDEVGLGGEEAKVVTVPYSFPPENGPIYTMNTTRLSQATHDEAMPKILEAVNGILDKEPERGLIHAPSYALANELLYGIDRRHASRLVSHGSNDRNLTLDQWLHSGREDSVFIGVAMTDGLDLADELARFQIIVKAPWPDRGDRQIVRRLALEDGERWYRAVTARSLWQAVGRVVRSATDVGRTYVLDSLACDLMITTAPEWGKIRISVGRKVIRAARPRPWEIS